MTQITMYPAQPDSPDYTLTNDITDSQTTIEFDDLTGLLAAPNTLTLRESDTDETPETVYYATYVSGNTLTVTRGYGGTTAKAFSSGDKACRAHTAFDHNTFRSNILDLDTSVFHKATTGEINALTVKASPAGTDVLMIEDSAGSAFTKAKITISTLVLTTDSRLSDARTPTAHASTHITGGSDIIPTATASATGLLPILENTGSKYLRDDGTWQTVGGGTGTVTSVAAGDGMNFTTITTSGTITMGTPGSITSSSTNAVAAGTHTHAIDTTIFTAANGKSITTPVMDGTATIGTTNTWADGAHIHPTDTSRAAEPLVLGTPTLTTLQDFLNGTGSGGRIYGGVITDAGSGLINISALKGFIVIANYSLGVDSPADIKFFDLAAQVNWGGSGVGTTLTADATNYVYVDYNSGTPIVKCTTDRTTIRYTDQFTVGRVFKVDASDVEVLTSGINLYDRVRLGHEKWIDTFGGLSYANGMAVSTTTGSGGVSPYLGPRPAFTAGIMYAGSNRITISAVDCNAGGTFTEYYTSDGGSTWTKVTSRTQLDNQNYNNTASGLSTLSANRYGVHWLYICPEGEMYVVLGQGNYTLAQAQAAAIPSIIPNYISQWCLLAAKIIVKKSDTDPYQIVSAWTSTFPISQPTSHNSLAGLQGGTTDQYYHLTAAQHTTLTNAWAAFTPSPVWGTADPTITTTVARYARTGNTVTFAVSFVISEGAGASSLVMSLPVAAPQTANYQFPLIAFKKITSGGTSLMSDPFAYIDYTEATPTIKFNQFGTLPAGYTAVLNISGSYEVA